MGLEPMTSSLPRTRSTTELQQQYPIHQRTLPQRIALTLRLYPAKSLTIQTISLSSFPHSSMNKVQEPIYFELLFNINLILYPEDRRSANIKIYKNDKKLKISLFSSLTGALGEPLPPHSFEASIQNLLYSSMTNDDWSNRSNRDRNALNLMPNLTYLRCASAKSIYRCQSYAVRACPPVRTW